MRGSACRTSDETTRKFLQSQFASQMRWSRANGHSLVFLELYAGSGRVATALHREGFGCITFEMSDGTEHDLLRPVVQRVIQGWMSGGCVGGIFFGTPCSSWPTARRGPPGSPWGPLRNTVHIMGLPGLSERDQARVWLGNRTMRQTAKCIGHAVRLGIPTMLENPHSSRLFQAPEIKKLGRLPSCHKWCLDQCQFGAPWRKRTAVWGWEAGHASPELDRRCVGRGSICSRTNRRHTLLQGSGPDGKLWTAIAQTYPKPLARTVATILIRAFHSMRVVAGLSRVV